MHLLTQLPPPKMPQPMPYSEWKTSVLATLPRCKKCDNTRRIECQKCNGEGETECDHCGHEDTCEECNGDGYQECNCTGGTTWLAYRHTITSDYQKLLRHRGLVMPTHEIEHMARIAAHS